MLIRRGETKDYEAYCRLGSETDRCHAELGPRYYKLPPSPARPQDYFESVIRFSDHAFFVAEEGGQIVGYIHLEQAEDPPHPTQVRLAWTKISEFAVDNVQRRKGIGRALVAKAKDWSISHGLKDVRINVAAFNNEMLAFCVRERFLLKDQTMVIPIS